MEGYSLGADFTGGRLSWDFRGLHMGQVPVAGQDAKTVTFALIEYSYKGMQKMKYVIDINVTPVDEDEPTIEDLVKRTQESVGAR